VHTCRVINIVASHNSTAFCNTRVSIMGDKHNSIWALSRGDHHTQQTASCLDVIAINGATVCLLTCAAVSQSPTTCEALAVCPAV